MHSLKIFTIHMLLVALAITPAYASGFSIDQKSSDNSKIERKVERLKEKLELTSQQEASIREILAANREERQLLQKGKKEAQSEIHEIVGAATLDEARLRELVHEQADRKTKMMVVKHDTQNRIDQVLTPEQQEQHKELRQHRQMRKKGSKHRTK